MAEKLPRLPFVLSASDLRVGTSVYFTGSDWSPAIADAQVAADAATADALAEELQIARRGNRVVEAFLFTVVTATDGSPVPAHYRERSRITGPSFRDDFGRNPAGEGPTHVPL